MLKTLTIKNFALIESAIIEFPTHFTTITGETGAGKSIMLKALSLCLGSKLEESQKSEKKTFLELEVLLPDSTKDLFESLDLEWQAETTITRTFDQTKSRSFINDQPIPLKTLKLITPHVLLLHTQTSQGLLEDEGFRFNFIDLWAGSNTELVEYRESLKLFTTAQKVHESLLESHQEAWQQKSFWEHQFSLFEDFDWKTDYAALVEEERSESQRAERRSAFESLNEWFASLDQLRTARNNFDKIEPESEISKRLEFIDIEMEDLSYECAKKMNESVSYSDPAERAKKLKQLSTLEYEFRIDGVEGLKTAYRKLETDIERFDQFEFEVVQSQKNLDMHFAKTKERAKELKQKRETVFETLNTKIRSGLSLLGMEHAQWECRLTERSTFNAQGMHDLEFFFQANKALDLLPISSVASGGEKARVMLVVQDLWSQKALIPTMIFDEIDTGVSGHIAEKMGKMMKDISSRAQVLAITHLPQVASLGLSHWHIVKTHNDKTETALQILTQEERVNVLAQMMSGENVSEEAMAQARGMVD